jgi:hypothetical protein
MLITVGAGETYQTWREALVFLTGLGVTEDTIIRQVADTIPETNTTASGVMPLSGFKLTLESDTPHGGDPTVGWKSTSVTAGAVIVGKLGMVGPGTVEVKDLHIAINSTGTPYGVQLNVTNWDSVDLSVHDCIITNEAQAGYGVHVSRFNVIAWNVDLYNLAVSGWSDGVYIAPANGGDWRVENVTALDAGGRAFFVSGPVAGTAAFINCVGQGAVGAFAGISDVSGYNNASVDATAADANWLAGSDNQTLITLNDEFVSQTINDANFLKLANTGVCHDGGSAPSIATNTEGIRGTARPHGVLYSIGADESEYIPAPSGGGSGSGGGVSSAIVAAMAAGYR